MPCTGTSNCSQICVLESCSQFAEGIYLPQGAILLLVLATDWLFNGIENQGFFLWCKQTRFILLQEALKCIWSHLRS